MFAPVPPAPDPPGPGEEPVERRLHPADREVTSYVLDCLNHGSKPSDIRTSLVAKGLTEDEAQIVVRMVLNHQTGGTLQHLDEISDTVALQAIGRRNMLIGGAICLGGLLVTFATMAAANGGGGRVVIAWGAIIWGGVQFFRGMSQANQGRD